MSTLENPFVAAIRASLSAKLEQLLLRPVIAAVVRASDGGRVRGEDDGASPFMRALALEMDQSSEAGTAGTYEEDEDGTCWLRVSFDYTDRWRGREREVLEAVKGTLEGAVAILSDDQRLKLERTPRDFLAMNPPPEAIELAGFDVERASGAERVTRLRLAVAPTSSEVRHIAIVPNLVQIERQLRALDAVETAPDDGPLRPLRALLGLSPATELPSAPVVSAGDLVDEQLDPFQRTCIDQAMSTPHFAVIHGPPGSGKTTVITGIIRRTVARGERVLAVSPTHVAVDNVVEKLVNAAKSEGGADRLEPYTIPIRFSARSKKLSSAAAGYWVGAKRQTRRATVAGRLEERLRSAIPESAGWFALEDKELATEPAPLTSALCSIDSVICGTPIGVLSLESVKHAPAGAFDVLIVDEVSKMTLPEFLAIAVKARRYILVGDPEQLPPYNGAEENGPTLDDVLNSTLELACSLAELSEHPQPSINAARRLLIVAKDPGRAALVGRAQLDAVPGGKRRTVATLAEASDAEVVVCALDEVGAAVATIQAQWHHEGEAPLTPVLVERGLSLPAGLQRVVEIEMKDRAQAVLFGRAFDIYHTLPWSRRSGHDLRPVRERRSLERVLPTTPAIQSFGADSQDAVAARKSLIEAMAARIAVSTISVYDWVTGRVGAQFDVSPLSELTSRCRPHVADAVGLFVGALKKQYRMHSSLSSVPRELFYFGEALFDHAENRGRRTYLVQVSPSVADDRHENQREVIEIGELLKKVEKSAASNGESPSCMVITPYRKQERLLIAEVEGMQARGALRSLQVEVCTMDRCQGREATVVMISLVRSNATMFFEITKRWNVALTRARETLFIVGDIDAYRGEARDARGDSGGRGGARLSLLSMIIEAYVRHGAAILRRQAP